jgi:hypothetical protein
MRGSVTALRISKMAQPGAREAKSGGSLMVLPLLKDCTQKLRGCLLA